MGLPYKTKARVYLNDFNKVSWNIFDSEPNEIIDPKISKVVNSGPNEVVNTIGFLGEKLKKTSKTRNQFKIEIGYIDDSGTVDIYHNFDTDTYGEKWIKKMLKNVLGDVFEVEIK
ncbi:MAG: hypothetical protein KAS04_05450 [Candidatus Aenigmarchaeota archaeon]|nr:hypothetical protein [Candidatus Aenigmarchaeota archaeon]